MFNVSNVCKICLQWIIALPKLWLLFPHLLYFSLSCLLLCFFSGIQAGYLKSTALLLHKIVASQKQTGNLVIYFLHFSFLVVLHCKFWEERFICHYGHPAWCSWLRWCFSGQDFLFGSHPPFYPCSDKTLVLFWLLPVWPSVAVANILFFSLLYGLQSGLQERKKWLPEELFYQWKIDAVICLFHIPYCVCNHNKTFILAF